MKLSVFTIAIILVLGMLGSTQSPLDAILGQLGPRQPQQLITVTPTPPPRTTQTSLAQKTSVRCTNAKCRVHWIFALDQSGSMRGQQWTKAKSLLQDIADLLELYTGQSMTVYTFDNRATLPPAEYADFINPTSWNSNVLPSPGGGTNFGQPLVRGLEFILLHRDSNTCFVMITDGEANYPDIEIQLFKQVVEYMKNRGYTVCTICYFIQAQATDVIPSSYDKTCQELKGNIVATQKNLRQSGGAAQARFVAPSNVQAFTVQNIESSLLDDFISQSSSFITQVSN